MIQRLNAVVVEPSPEAAETIAQMLQTVWPDVAIERIDTPEDLDEVLEREGWDVIIANSRIPGFDPKTIIDAVHRSGVDLPIIMTCAKCDEALAVRALEAGADDCIPLSEPARLAPVVQRELRKSRLRNAFERTQEEKAALQAQLEHGQKMEAIGELAAGVAHSFNNLLTVVVGNSEMIRKRVPESVDISAQLEAIHQAAEKATTATRSLLTFSRSLVADKREVHLQDLVNETSRLLRHTLPATIELAVTIRPGPPLYCHADALQLQQLLLNLAIHARDAMPDGGSLEMTFDSIDPEKADVVIGSAATGKADLYARVTIVHTGDGSAEVSSIGTGNLPFTTEHRALRAGGELTAAYSIVAHHGGTMDVHTVPGQNTTITVLLPATIGSSVDETRPAGEEPVPKGHGEMILVAEDDQFVREVIITNLRTNEYEVIDASSGRSMLDVCREHRDDVQLLIVDVDLPERNGLSCLRELRSEGIRAPAIIVTGGLDTDQGDDLPDHTLVLRKPFQMAHLAALVHNQLCEQREKKEISS